jgi:hypothetical protein
MPVHSALGLIFVRQAMTFVRESLLNNKYLTIFILKNNIVLNFISCLFLTLSDDCDIMLLRHCTCRCVIIVCYELLRMSSRRRK